MSTSAVSIRTLTKLMMFPFLVYLLNYLLLNFANAAFWSFPIDVPMHALGGLSIAYVASHTLGLLGKKNTVMVKSALVKVFMILATVALAAVVWEFYEFLHDYFFGSSYQTGIVDTMKDLFMGLLGGLLFCIVAVRKIPARLAQR